MNGKGVGCLEAFLEGCLAEWLGEWMNRWVDGLMGAWGID